MNENLLVSTTYNFSKQYNILSPYYKDAARNISIFLPNMNSFNCTMKNKISWNKINTKMITHYKVLQNKKKRV